MMAGNTPFAELINGIEPLYREYQEICENNSEGTYFVEYRPEIKADKKKDGYKISSVEYALNEANFATDSVRNLFASLAEYEADSSAEFQGIELLESFKRIPQDLQKNARVVQDGYYYAGIYHKT